MTTMLKMKPLLLIVLLQLAVGAVVLPNWDRLRFLIVARPATEQEIREVYERRSPAGELWSGAYVHRWKDDPVYDAPLRIGTWICYYGNSPVMKLRREYDRRGDWDPRETVWFPSGRIWLQYDHDLTEVSEQAPWQWGEIDQSIGTKQLANCDLSGMPLDDHDFRDADLRAADLIDCSFEGATFAGANLTFADLGRAEFDGADFDGADFGGANLTQADLRGGDLSGAKNLSLEQVMTATHWDMTKGESPTRFPVEISEELTRRSLQVRVTSCEIFSHYDRWRNR